MQSTSDESKSGGKAPLKRSREGCMEDKGGPGIRNCNYRGVRQRKLGNWVAEIREPNKRKRIWLGSFHTALDAALAYDQASRSMYGSTAFLNLPNYNCPNRSSNKIASSVPSNLGCTSSITSNHTECSSANMVVDSTNKKNGTKNISKSNLEGKLSLGEINHQGNCRNSVSGNVHQSTLDELQCTLSRNLINVQSQYLIQRGGSWMLFLLDLRRKKVVISLALRIHYLLRDKFLCRLINLKA